MLDPPLPKTRTARFWVYCGDWRNPYTVYDDTTSRKRDGPADFLREFQGCLQADAFAGYDGIYAGGQVRQVLCWVHARRKLNEARTVQPEPWPTSAVCTTWSERPEHCPVRVNGPVTQRGRTGTGNVRRCGSRHHFRR
jgi:hypothetical protein